MSELALVTGASRGIGRAIVELLARKGRNVIASARDSAALRELASVPNVTVLEHDLSRDPAALVERVAKLGTLREVVLAAGIAQHRPLRELREQELRAQLELNFVAPFLMLHALANVMQRGSIVVLASTLAERPAPTTSAYAASKAALVSAAKNAALELAPEIRVNVLAPGVVDTDMVRAPRRALQPGEDASALVADQLEALRKLHPLGRLGSAAEVAEAALYLLEAPWLTGSVLTIDGGLTLA